jgi:hypothetical protein
MVQNDAGVENNNNNINTRPTEQATHGVEQ